MIKIRSRRYPLTTRVLAATLALIASTSACATGDPIATSPPETPEATPNLECETEQDKEESSPNTTVVMGFEEEVTSSTQIDPLAEVLPTAEELGEGWVLEREPSQLDRSIFQRDSCAVETYAAMFCDERETVLEPLQIFSRYSSSETFLDLTVYSGTEEEMEEFMQYADQFACAEETENIDYKRHPTPAANSADEAIHSSFVLEVPDPGIPSGVESIYLRYDDIVVELSTTVLDTDPTDLTDVIEAVEQRVGQHQNRQ